MFKLALRSLIDKKLRFALTTLVVVIGVMFVVGSFTLTDSLRSTFAGLAEDIAEGADLTVRVDQEFGGDFDRATVPEAVAGQIAGVEGVGRVQPQVAAIHVFIVDGDGEPIRPPGPPALGFSFNPSFFTTEGRQPAVPGEFAADTVTAANNGLRIGETYEINGPLYAESFELVGVFNFGDPDSHTGLGQTMAAFELDEAQRFFGMEDGYQEIGVLVSAGSEISEVQSRLAAELGDGYSVITAEVDAAEQEDDFNQVLDIFNTILLVFAFIAVFVSAFIINNTFQIILGQRVREIGLWRAIGATPRQVSRSVITESAIVGVISTVIGIGLGLVLALVLRAILALIGFPLPPGPLTLQPRTVLLAMVVGLGVTMISSVAPAMRARRISPVAALTHDFRLGATGLRRRLIAGGAVFAAGVAALAAGMTAGLDTTPTFALLGAGAVFAFVGINILSPAFARPAASMLGRPVRALFGVPGRLASDNAARSPRRTASTAGALMIGLALMGLAAVVGESLKKTFVNIIENAVEADYYIQSASTGFGPPAGFPAQVADEIEALDEIDSVVRIQFAFSGLSVDGEPRDIVATRHGPGRQPLRQPGELGQSWPAGIRSRRWPCTATRPPPWAWSSATPSSDLPRQPGRDPHPGGGVRGRRHLRQLAHRRRAMGPPFQPQRPRLRQRPHRRPVRRRRRGPAGRSAGEQPGCHRRCDRPLSHREGREPGRVPPDPGDTDHQSHQGDRGAYRPVVLHRADRHHQHLEPVGVRAHPARSACCARWA